jgi:4-amino-4-deoxy-L-arabinose transferase-like glycosyltransferase
MSVKIRTGGKPPFLRSKFLIPHWFSMTEAALVEQPVGPARKSSRLRGRLLLGALLLASIAIYLLGNARMALFDRDEPWYAQVSRHMLQSGDWVVPRFGNVIFEGKPVFAFWCQAISMRVFGQDEFGARFPSVVCGVLTLIVLWWGVSRFVGSRRALWSVFVLGSSALHIAISKMALVDSELLLWITIAQLCLAMVYAARGSLWVCAVFWVSTGLALLTKGPVVLGTFGGTLIGLAMMDVGKNVLSPRAWIAATRWWWGVRPWMALVISPAVVGPWILMVGHRSPGFLKVTLEKFMLAPIFDKPLNSRSVMPGFYLAVIWPAFLPWSLLLPITLLQGWKNRRLLPVRFCLAAVLGPWVVIEIVKQKLPHYLLPMFPPLAFLTADVIVRCVRGEIHIAVPKSWKWGVLVWAAAIVLMGAGPWLAAVPKFHYEGLPYVAMVTLTVTGLVLAGVTGALLIRGKLKEGFLAMGIGAMLVAVILFRMMLPGFAPLRATQLAGAAMYRAGFKDGDAVGLYGYSEPSITFYLNGAGTVIDSPPVTWPKWVVMSGDKFEGLTEGQKKELELVGIFRSANTGSKKASGEVVVVRRKQS